MDYERLMQEVIVEVLKRLKKDQHKALVIFTGSATGFEESIKQIKMMRDGNWDIEVLINKSAEELFSKKQFADNLDGLPIYYESQYPLEKDFLESLDLVVIPVLTMDFAAKISLGIADTPVLSLVAYSIINGIPFLGAIEACIPEGRIRNDCFNRKKPEAYFNMIHGYISKLKDFGIKMVQLESLMGEANALFNNDEKNDSEKIDNEKSGLITREEIIIAKNTGIKIKAGKKTIVTALAKETAHELGVEIVCI